MRDIIRLETPKSVKNSVQSKKLYVGIINKTSDSLEFFLSGDVGDSFTESDGAFISKLLTQNKGKAITMRVSSYGGSAFDGLQIHNALAQHDGPTTSVIESVAASAASLAAIGADRVLMQENATYQIHQGIALAFGHIAEMKDTIAWLEQFNAAAASTYAAKTGKPEEYIAAALLGENGDGTVYSAAQALEIGFIDEIIPLKAGKKKSRNNAADRMNFAASRSRMLKMR